MSEMDQKIDQAQDAWSRHYDAAHRHGFYSGLVFGVVEAGILSLVVNVTWALLAC